MRKITYCLALFILVFTLKISARIIETERFSEITNYVTSETLVILDIDDTLLIPLQTLGSDVWFCDRIHYYQFKGDLASTAFRKALEEWEGIRHLTKVKLVEDKTDEIICDLQQQNIVVMALTTQGLTLSTCTTNQLNSLNIDVSKTAPSKEDVYFINNGRGVLYQKGILFTCGTDKGRALFKYLDSIDFYPKHIVFINDKESHLKDVEKNVIERGIAFDGLRYSYSDKRVNEFDRRISDLQWEFSTFSTILSDDEAKELSP